MRYLVFNFAVLRWFGACRPIEWDNVWKGKLYKIYTFIVAIMVYTYCISCVIQMIISTILSTSNLLAGLVENCLILLSIISVCFKLNTIVGRRDALLDAFELLSSADKYWLECEKMKQFDNDTEKKCRFV